MIKVCKNEYINDGMIEAVCTYKQGPLSRITSTASRKNMISRFLGRYGYKCLFIMSDGYLFLCPYTPETYMSKMDVHQYLQVEAKRYFIKRTMVRMVCTTLSSGQRRDLVQAKKDGRYINLSGCKKIKYYIFTTSGRIYGTQQITNLMEPEL